MNMLDFPICLYCTKEPVHIEELDLCRGSEDFRKVYIVTELDKKFVIKHCSNEFTDLNKIFGWFRLADAYNSLGIYCPRLITNSSGERIYHYSEEHRDYYVYAEEYAKFDTVEHVGKENLRDANGQPCYLAELMRTVGKVAKEHFDFLDWPSQFSVLEPHVLPDDFIDETTRAATRFAEYVRTELPEFQERMEGLLALFYKCQSDLKEVYSQLPVSCFQGDLNDTNILINSKHQFAGVIDFNVCGKEPVLNYAIREATMHTEDSILFDENGDELYFFSDEHEFVRTKAFLQNISYIGEYYKFNELERNTFPLLYRYINSFWWEQVYAIKQNSNNKAKVQKIFDWIEFQLTRDDICLPECYIASV